MQIAIITILAVMLVIVVWKMFKYKIGLRFITYYIEKHNIQLDNDEMQKCKKEVVEMITVGILHKKK